MRVRPTTCQAPDSALQTLGFLRQSVEPITAPAFLPHVLPVSGGKWHTRVSVNWKSPQNLRILAHPPANMLCKCIYH